MKMKLKSKLGVLLVGTALAAIPTLSHATPPNLVRGQNIFVQGHMYKVIDGALGDLEDEFPASPEDQLEDAAEVYVSNHSAQYGNWGSLTQRLDLIDAPFDAGLSILLGAGAVAGLKKARNRRKAAANA
jgi:hypothetical protein